MASGWRRAGLWAPVRRRTLRDQQPTTNDINAMSNDTLAVRQPTAEEAAFELVQRQAKMLASSTLVPKEFQNNMANCAIGLNIAKRLGADPFLVIQNIDVIHGRPSFRATFLIAMVNASGRFSPLQFRDTKDGVIAYAKALATGEIVEGPEVTLQMAKDEGWSTKAGSKWKTMPRLMLRYRAAAFFARIYAPDITLGMLTAEEAEDVREERDVTPKVAAPIFAPTSPQEPTQDIDGSRTQPLIDDDSEYDSIGEPNGEEVSS